MHASEFADQLPDESIASVLNRLGMRSAKGIPGRRCGCAIFAANIRSRFTVRANGPSAELILHEAASRLGVSKMTVVRLLWDWLQPASQVCVGAPCVIQEDDIDRCRPSLV